MIDKNDIRYEFLRNGSKGSKVQKFEGSKGVALQASDQTPDERKDNMRRILRYRAMYDAMEAYRLRRRRIKRYEKGQQWDDRIKLPDGRTISEGEHIKEQGKVPLKNNVILQTQNSVVGVFRDNYTHPEALARTRDNQQVGEMVTAMLQYIEQVNDTKELDVADFMEGLRGGLAVQYVNFIWNDKVRKKEVEIDSVSPTMFFMNSNVRDTRGNDITSIGRLVDLPLSKVLQRFAKTDKDEEKIREIYRHVDKLELASYYNTFVYDQSRNMDFFCPTDKDMCRVIEAWELEEEDTWLVHDKYEKTLNIYPKKDKAALEAMIAERDRDIEENGLDREKTEIVMEKHTDVYWYYRFMSPRGDVLQEGRSPFSHNDHPFVVYMSRLVDGEIYSFEESIIDQQRYINQLITLNYFIMSSSAKGVLVFPENAIPKGMNKEDILDQWTSYRGVIFANLKPGMQLPTQISTNATNIGTNEALALQLQLVRDISGVHGAMLGKEAKSGTAASLYAQETSNAQTNLLDTIESFAAFRKRRDYKVAKILPQCYDKDDYTPVAGREYSEKAKEWIPELAAKFDYYILILETANADLYEAQLNQMLLTALQQRLIDFKMAIQAGRFPFGDKLLRLIEREEQKMQQQQALQQALQMQGQAAGIQAAEAGASEGEIAKMGADAAVQVMQAGNEEQELNAQAGQANPLAMQMVQQALG